MGKEREQVNAGRERQRFSREFKLEAVRLLGLGQKPISQLALELGVRRSVLHRWQREAAAKGEQVFRGSGRKPAEEQGKVERLEAELKRVTEERDILKKAAAYFARELG